MGRVRRLEEPEEERAVRAGATRKESRDLRAAGEPQRPWLDGPEPAGSSPGAGRAHAARDARGRSQAAGSR